MSISKSADPGFVYVFTNPLFPQWVKIGKAKSWSKRLRDCQTYAPLDYTVVATLKTASMSKIERLVQDYLSLSERQEKEFFFVGDPSKAVAVLRDVATRNGEIGGLTIYNEDDTATAAYGNDGKPRSCTAGGKSQGVVFHAVVGPAKSRPIRMEVRNNEYVVLAGSRFCPMTEAMQSSDAPTVVSLRNDRKSIEGDPLRCEAGRLLVDVPFRSSSRALAIMIGYCSIQGPKYWLDDEGRSLREYL